MISENHRADDDDDDAVGVVILLLLYQSRRTLSVVDQTRYRADAVAAPQTRCERCACIYIRVFVFACVCLFVCVGVYVCV